MAISNTVQDKDYYERCILGKKEIQKKLEDYGQLEDYGLTINEVRIVFAKEYKSHEKRI
jgi:hypothetical protein